MTAASESSRRRGPLVHEETYRWRNPVAFVHRARLRAVAGLFRRWVPDVAVSWADFGCSSGFIIQEMIARGMRFDRIVGYDNSERLLELAREKGIERAEFLHCDMNRAMSPAETFDVVSCFETLEHVGNLESAVANLYSCLSKDGVLLISVPNETGLPGLLKVGGRRALGRNTDDEFFAGRDMRGYYGALLRNRYIDGFREPGRDGYGSHLGFDYRRLAELIRDRYVAPGKLHELAQSGTLLNMNRLMAYRRAGE